MKIGVFDSGLGGLTILDAIRQRLPQYDYLYLGDNARAPYGTRSFETIYHYTLEAVRYLQKQGCRLIILACNTASAKALRTIQQHDIDPDKVRVLGVIRPTVEETYPQPIPKSGEVHIGILATPGTVASGSYVIELEKAYPIPERKGDSLFIHQQACAMWVPLIEAGEHRGEGADYFVHEYIDALLAQDPQIDTILLGCTHYPLIQDKIEAALEGKVIRVISQGPIVARSLEDYLSRHPEINSDLSTEGTCLFSTTDNAEMFETAAKQIFGQEELSVEHVDLDGPTD